MILLESLVGVILIQLHRGGADRITAVSRRGIRDGKKKNKNKINQKPTNCILLRHPI